ncbi:PAS domain S-box protein [Pseudoalteromonas sp. JBTF-M23]|uniref:Sensor protein FixL n=1 Tax=Pseudoalteromonas caenipelagi TaxID=2726988 RepID=A0A849VD67_9GAMM|nr:PAS domain-containing hybrid sensor histidine kinase/response regulator [Pseudoalteromonas caenipelagi]NOU50503.1 PAS domain S-box protein [Pseudoalteromonas caenipelagi]
MKWLEAIPYPYVIAFLTTALLSSLFIVVQDAPDTQILSNNQTPKNEQIHLLTQELIQFNQLVDTTKNDPKQIFAIWKAGRANLDHNNLSEYFIYQNTLTIAASDNQKDIGNTLPNTLEDTHFLSSVEHNSPYIHQDKHHLFGAISLCVSAADCYYYLQIRNLPSEVITHSNFIYIGNWLLIGLALILLNIAYLKFRMRTLKSALATHFEQPPGFSLISTRDDITLITQSIVNKSAASDATQSDDSEHMDNLSAQLQSQFSRLSAIINTVVDGIITIDSEGTVETFNPAAERMFGYKADQVIGQNVKMLMPAPYQQEHDSYIDNYLTTGEAKVIGSGREVLGQKADGALFPMALSISEMSVDGQRMFTGIVRDISEIAEHKSQLSDHVARIKAIIETVIDGIITINEKGIIDSFNPAAEKIFGYNEQEVIGKNIKMLMPAPYQQEHDQYLVNYMTSGIKKVIGSGREVLGQRKDGSVFSMSLAVSEMLVGDTKMFTGIVRDITEQKKYETALTQYRIDLEKQVQQRTNELESATKLAQAASIAKSKFLSRMSHELRTPLNAIIGFTQLLEEEDLSESQIDSLKEISTAGKDLTLMVNEILQVASVQTGALSLNIEEVLLNESLKESINQLLPAANQKHISISFDETAQYYVKGDYSKLKQVITNLIDNAIRYSDENTQITITLTQDHDSVCTHIKDTGSGLSSEKLANMFEPFERGADEYSGQQGIGIGLTIAKEFIEAMDGKIDVQSADGQGTTVTFILPLARIEDTRQSNQLTVLYIEDNVTNRKLMKRLISRFDNIIYHEAIDGVSGIEAAKKLKPNLILLDINLPDISGYEVFSMLKKCQSTQNIAVVGVSANAMSTDQDKARNLGFSDYLTKPIELDVLTNLFECIFKQQSDN